MGQILVLMHRTHTNFKITTCILNKLYKRNIILLIYNTDLINSNFLF